MHATIRLPALRLLTRRLLVLRLFAAALLPALGFLSLGPAAPARADDKPLRLVSAYAAGGVADTLMRLLAEELRTTLGRPVIVENKPGAAGRVGTQYAKAAPADGSVLLFTPIAPMSIFPLVYDRPGYDAVKDFLPISQIATFDFGVAVGPGSPVRSLRDLVAWLKADPARASFGSPAAGSLPHFVGVQFGNATSIELRHVPYKGNPPGLADLMGGHLPLFFTSSQDLAEGHKAGKLRVLATSGTARSPALPDVPTFKEAGYPIEGEGWYGVYAPAGTPADIVAKLNTAIVAAARTPAIKARMLALGLHPTGTTPAELGRIQRADLERWAPVIKASGFRPEQ